MVTRQVRDTALMPARPVRQTLGRRAAAVAAPLLAACLLALATACSAPAPSPQVSSLVGAQAKATPTLPAPGEAEAQYLPLLIEGKWLLPTPTATAGPYNGLPKTMNQGFEVVSALTSQRVVESRYLLDIQGEVRNSGGHRGQSIRVVLVARTAAQQCGRGVLTLLGQEDVILGPGDVWPFSGSLYADCSPQEVAFQVVAVDTDTTPLRLAIEGAALGVTAGGDWQLSGTLRNGSSVSVSYPRAVVTLHGADGAYVASGLAYAGVASLAPGGTTTFAVVIPAAGASGWASYVAIGTGELG